MRRRYKAGGEAVKTSRRKTATQKRRRSTSEVAVCYFCTKTRRILQHSCEYRFKIAERAADYRQSAATGWETEIARLSRELHEAP
jgi:hypothetical protein